MFQDLQRPSESFKISLHETYIKPISNSQHASFRPLQDTEIIKKAIAKSDKNENLKILTLEDFRKTSKAIRQLENMFLINNCKTIIASATCFFYCPFKTWKS